MVEAVEEVCILKTMSSDIFFIMLMTTTVSAARSIHCSQHSVSTKKQLHSILPSSRHLIRNRSNRLLFATVRCLTLTTKFKTPKAKFKTIRLRRRLKSRLKPISLHYQVAITPPKSQVHRPSRVKVNTRR